MLIASTSCPLAPVTGRRENRPRLP